MVISRGRLLLHRIYKSCSILKKKQRVEIPNQRDFLLRHLWQSSEMSMNTIDPLFPRWYRREKLETEKSIAKGNTFVLLSSEA